MQDEEEDWHAQLLAVTAFYRNRTKTLLAALDTLLDRGAIFSGI